MKNPEKEIIENLSKIFGCSFISIKGYESTTGETSNQVINIGFSYENAVKKDIELLKKSRFDDLMKEQARLKLLNSMEGNLGTNKSNQSLAQIKAYIHIGKAVKLHIEKRELYIYGMSISKTVVVHGVSKKKSENPMVIAENAVKKELNLSTPKYRMFKFSKLDELRVSGKTIKMNEVEIEGVEVL